MESKDAKSLETNYFSVEDLASAETVMIMTVQKESFSDEIDL